MQCLLSKRKGERMKNVLFNYGNLPKALNKQEIYELFIRMKKGDSLAKEKIVLHNLRLVIVVLKRYYGCGVNLEELISVGNIGLMKAINTFNINKNLEFSTYAAVCINNEMLMYLRKDSKDKCIISYDKLINNPDNDELTYEAVLQSDEDIILDYEDKNVYQMILDIIKTLSKRDYLCVVLSFGLDGYEKVPQKDIANMLNVTQPHISRTVKRAIDKVRNELIKNGILEENAIVKREKSLVKGA